MTSRASRVPSLLVIGVGLAFTFAGVKGAAAAEPPVGLGTATSFGVLAGSTVTNTGETRITGDVGVSPGSAVVGFPPGLVAGGTIHAADAVAAQAQADVTTAYNDAAGRATTAAVGPELGGLTLVGGVYTGATLGLTGELTLDAQGVAGTVFIFQGASTLITASNSTVRLINGASPCNVFWKVGSSATLGTGSTFVGTILALTSISAGTNATVEGRLLARNGAVTLDDNTVTRPACTTVPPTTTSTALASTTSVPASTTSVPASTTSVPASTTSVPASTTSVPASSTSVPASTTSVPASSTSVPVSTTVAAQAPTTIARGALVTTSSLLATSTSGAVASTTSSRLGSTALAAQAGTASGGVGGSTGGGGGNTALTSRTTTLASTGSAHLTLLTGAGLLVVTVGILMLVASQRASRRQP